jgi:predicted ABC-type ATPase
VTSRATTSPTIYIIAGPNGAGKTTFATTFLPQFVLCSEFLNADLIAAGLSPFAPQLQNVRASELMLQRMDELVEKRATFSFETTLAARSYHRRVPQWQAMGYRVHLFFLWLPSSNLALLRVANRVKQGGHDIPVETIRRRYESGLKNFQTLYRSIVDHWYCFDGSTLPPELIAQSSGESVEIFDSEHWSTFSQSCGGMKYE